MKRLFYLKAGNAVQEYQRLARCPGQRTGGAESFLADFLKLARGRPCVVISLHSAGSLDEHLEQDNLSLWSYARQGRTRTRTMRRAARMLRLIRNSLLVFVRVLLFRPDTVLCWAGSLPCWSCFAAARLIRARFVFSRHITFTFGDKSLWKRFMARMDCQVLCRSDAVVVHGPFLREKSLQEGVKADRMIVFDCVFAGDPVWESLPEGSEDSPGPRKSPERTILYVGRMESAKGITDLLQACRQIIQNNKKIRLCYAGTGNDLERLQKDISDLGLTSQIKCLGRVEHDQLPGLMAGACCLAVPTRSLFPEGRCMAAMEGLIAGVPVVAPDFGPFPYLVKDRVNGLLFRPDSPEDLGKCLERIINHEDLRSRLRQGARASGLELLSNRCGYYQALEQALDRAG